MLPENWSLAVPVGEINNLPLDDFYKIKRQEKVLFTIQELLNELR